MNDSPDSSPFSSAPTLRFPILSDDEVARAEEHVSPPSQNDVALVARALVEEGTQAWPSVELSAEALVSLVGPRLVAKGAKLSPELYLAAACLAGNPFALAILDGQYLAKVPAHVQKIVTARGGDVDAMVATLRDRLLHAEGSRAPRLLAYSGRGLLAAWLRVVAVRFAIEGRTEKRARVAAAEADHAVLLRSAAFRRAIDAARAALPADQREVIRLVYGEGITGDRAAKLLGTSTTTVTRRLGRALGALLEAARDALVDGGLGATSLDRASRDVLAHLQAMLRG